MNKDVLKELIVILRKEQSSFYYVIFKSETIYTLNDLIKIGFIYSIFFVIYYI